MKPELACLDVLASVPDRAAPPPGIEVIPINLALGKPVVQFDLTEGRVSAGEASWYARPNDVADLAQKIVSLLADPAQRARMSAAGRERIEHVLRIEIFA